jgi:hypothetical protein
MRYYLTEHVETGELAVIGETVGARDPIDGTTWPHAAADGPGMTREQLLELPGGRQALWAWERGDDSAWIADALAARRRHDVAEVRDMAADRNPWAIQLVVAGCPPDDVRAFLRSDRATYGWTPRAVP